MLCVDAPYNQLIKHRQVANSVRIYLRKCSDLRLFFLNKQNKATFIYKLKYPRLSRIGKIRQVIKLLFI